MKWIELKKEVQELLLSRKLKYPNIRLNALGKLENILRTHFPEIIANPKRMLNFDKKIFKNNLAEFKDNFRLNSAESSVINNFYQILGTK